MPAVIRVDHDANVDGEASKWSKDGQGRVSHRHGSYWRTSAAETLYVRRNSKWEKAGYFCHECNEGLLLTYRGL